MRRALGGRTGSAANDTNESTPSLEPTPQPPQPRLLLEHQLVRTPVDGDAPAAEEVVREQPVAAHSMPPQLARIEGAHPARDPVLHHPTHRDGRDHDLRPRVAL